MSTQASDPAYPRPPSPSPLPSLSLLSHLHMYRLIYSDWMDAAAA